jgi:hypothetical protein
MRVIYLRVDSWNKDLVARQSQVGTNVGTEAEDIIGIRH